MGALTLVHSILFAARKTAAGAAVAAAGAFRPAIEIAFDLLFWSSQPPGPPRGQPQERPWAWVVMGA